MRHWYTSCSIFDASHKTEGLALGRNLTLVVAAAAMAMLSACAEKPSGADTTPVLTAATLGDQDVRPVSDYLTAAPYAGADRANGERQAQICRACHSLDEGGNNMIGPGLFGFFGTKAGSRGAFDYSAVLKEADFVWTPRALDAWLAYPGRFLPGNRMTFAGVQRESDRNDLIAYLLAVTGDVSND